MADYEDYDVIINTTDDQYEDIVAAYLWPNEVEKVFVYVLMSMMAIGVIGNFLVVFVVVSRPSMWSTMNIFLTNLACADLLILLFCLPPTVINDVTKTFWFSTPFCKTMLFLQNTSVYVSIISLVFITFERWRAITYPLKSQVKPTKIIIAGTWVISILLSLPEPFTLQLQKAEFQRENFTSTWGTQCKETWSQEFQRKYQLAQALLLYLFPLLLISCMCLHMSRTLNYCQLAIGKRQLLNRRKAVRMLVAVVCLFTVSYLPVHLYNLASAFDLLNPDSPEDVDMNWIAIRKLLPRVFSYSSSCLNPLLYNFMCGRFRASFARIACCKSSSSTDFFHNSRRRTFDKSDKRKTLL